MQYKNLIPTVCLMVGKGYCLYIVVIESNSFAEWFWSNRGVPSG